MMSINELLVILVSLCYLTKGVCLHILYTVYSCFLMCNVYAFCIVSISDPIVLLQLRLNIQNKESNKKKFESSPDYVDTIHTVSVSARTSY